MVRSRLAPVPPIASVLPPGAGNEESKKALKTDDERAKKTEERAVRQTGVVQGHLDTPAVSANRDGDVASIATIEQTQGLVSRGCPADPGGSRSLRGVPCSCNLGRMASRSSASGLGGPAASLHSQIRASGVPDTTRPSVARRSLVPRYVLALRIGVHFQRSPASRTKAELANADSIRRTRKD